MPPATPILPGCHPDPSICRVGSEFFVVTSSFTQYPGLPLHRSNDLVEWTLAGHVLEGDSWVDLSEYDLSDGVWAPTIRHHNGVFYVVFAVAQERRCAATFVCTAADIAGPWTRTEVVGAYGIDPSIFFDDDDRAWFTAARDTTISGATGPGEIWLREFDLMTCQLTGPEHILWHGAVTGAWVEAPHIYRRDGRYHLIAAEGGTEFNHAVTAAIADAVIGPYRTDPRSPLLTHRHLGENAPVQNVGHADLVTAADGSEWAVVLGTRPIDGHHTLGRESFLVPAVWETAGPVLAPGVGAVVGRAGACAEQELDAAFDFGEWVSLRGPVVVAAERDAVALAASPVPIGPRGTPAFVGRPQTSHAFSFAAEVHPEIVPGQRVGIVALQNDRHFVALFIQHTDAGLVARSILCEGGAERDLGWQRIDGTATLVVRSDGRQYELSVSSGREPNVLAVVPHTALSTETAGGFVGVLLGFLNEGEPTAPVARFTRLKYSTVGQNESLLARA